MNPVKDLLVPNVMDNPILNIAQMMSGGMSPQMIVQQMVEQDPRCRNIVNQLQSQAGGMSPRDIAFQVATQRGVSKQQVMQMAAQLGLK